MARLVKIQTLRAQPVGDVPSGVLVLDELTGLQ
jgi:hypothetical protein